MRGHAMQTVQQWEEVLQGLLQPDTEIVRAAGKQLNLGLKHPDSIMKLMQLLHTSPSLGVKQLAAVLLRKKIKRNWDGLNEQAQKSIMEAVLALLSSESNAIPRIIRSAIADFAAKIATLLLGGGDQWPQLWAFIAHATSTGEVVHRETVLRIFSELILDDDVWEDHLQPKFADIFNLISVGLRDPDNDVRVGALKCVIALLTRERHKTVPEFRSKIVNEWVPVVVQVMKYCIETGNDQVAKAFEVISRLAEQDFENLAPFVPNIINFMLDIAQDADADLAVRQKALYLVEFIITYRPKTFLSGNVFDRTLDTVIRLCTDTVGEEEEDDERWNFGVKVIDSIALHVPAKFGFGVLSEKALAMMSHQSPLHRKLGVSILGFMAEGYHDQVADQLGQILPLVMTAFQDSSVEVKRGALFSLGELCGHIQFEMKDHIGVVMQALLEGTNHPDELIKVKSMNSIRQACAGLLTDDIGQYLDAIVATALNLATNSTDMDLVEVSLGAVAASVSAARDKAVAIIPKILPTIMQFVSVTDIERISYRAHGTECLAAIVEAGGPELIGPHFQGIVDLVMTNFTIKDQDVHIYSFLFFEAACKTFGPALAAFLPRIMPEIIEACASNEGIIIVSSDHLAGVIEDEDQQLAIEDAENIQVDVAFCEVKCSAIYALGWLAAECGPAYQTYLDQSLYLLCQLIGWIDESVKKGAATALVQLMDCMKAITAPTYKYQSGLPAAQQQPPAEYAAFGRALMLKYLERLEVEDQMSVVSAIVDAMSNLALNFGPCFVEPHLAGIVENFGLILTHKAPCQLVRESFEEEDEDDLDLFTKVMACLVNYAKVCKGLLVPTLERLLPAVVPYISEGAPDSYLQIGVGEIAEFAYEMGPAFAPFADAMMPFAISHLSNDCYTVQSNAAYCAGNLVATGEVALVKYFQSLIAGLGTLFSEETHPMARENACGAMCKIIKHHPTINLPFDQILPHILASLPCKVDHEPSNAIYSCLAFMLQKNEPTFMLHLPEIIALFCIDAPREKELSDATRTEMLALVKSYASAQAAEFSQILQSLVRDQRVTEGEMAQLQAWLS